MQFSDRFKAAFHDIQQVKCAIILCFLIPKQESLHIHFTRISCKHYTRNSSLFMKIQGVF